MRRNAHLKNKAKGNGSKIEELMQWKKKNPNHKRIREFFKVHPTKDWKAIYPSWLDPKKVNKQHPPSA